MDTVLGQFSHFGVQLGLERIQRLLANLGNPQQQVPIIHVAGSNGKGSVCAYLSSVLMEAGYRVGRYTSPHLVSWNERICLNETLISSTNLHQLLLQVIAAIRESEETPTQFEVITAAAWLYFAQQRVDIAVIEVGLGGRLDATNVCDRPLVSVITSLSREHWQRLGPTLADISREKAGILKPNCPAVIAPLPPEAKPVIQQRLTDLNCPTLFPTPAYPHSPNWAVYSPPPSSLLLHPSSLKFPLPLPGAHQLINSALAIATLQILQQQGWKISEAAIVSGMAKTQWPGRLQWIVWQNQPMLIDGAHNPAAAIALRHYIDNSEKVRQPIHWVMGMLTTKDHADVFKALLRGGDRLYLVPVPDHLSAEPEALAKLALEICPDLASCEVCEDAIAALHTAIKTGAGSASFTPVLCGSLYLIGHFFRNSSIETR
ncbi:MAG: bifunctional folylpolyglutamate synthase/dihydrofolate synthase [Leptolyngbyaceae cyanobacterium SL_5_9]|nr:bifunctional folylpolyglutamate synthase/dihydrofolate synthase [Leptolyngbyaceae cyanobacterium SL_5_9]NJO72701.1 bifunctional folylpolyglutamate synthase/dihydrofolate synthase [Leptolyngbyaceae cyanobacterium RM1_406_9]